MIGAAHGKLEFHAFRDDLLQTLVAVSGYFIAAVWLLTPDINNTFSPREQLLTVHLHFVYLLETKLWLFGW